MTYWPIGLDKLQSIAPALSLTQTAGSSLCISPVLKVYSGLDLTRCGDVRKAALVSRTAHYPCALVVTLVKDPTQAFLVEQQ